MNTAEKTIDVLNDLIRINNDRVKGYEKAVNQLSGKDLYLETLFNRMASDSRIYVKELSEQITNLGGEVIPNRLSK